MPCLSWLYLNLKGGGRAAAPKGVDDLSFHTWKFSPSPPPRIGLLDRDLDLEAEILASRLGSGTPSRLGFLPLG